MKIVLPAALAIASLSACSSIVKGTDQQVVVNTDPQGARCEITREGEMLAVADPTPQPVTISKSKNDLTFNCTKDGYAKATKVLPSDVEAMTLGNILVGGVIGLAVDAGTGAMNKYDANITISMNAEESAPVAVAPAPAAPAPAQYEAVPAESTPTYETITIPSS